MAATTTDENPPAAGRRITLAEIAEAANLSLATVSKVLNGRTDVSPATRSRVEQLLNDHGYLRRSPSSGTGVAKMLELVFHELDSDFAIEIIRGVERVTRASGISLILTESGDRHTPGPGWVDGVLRRRPVGVVLVFSALTQGEKQKLRSRGVNFVVVDPAGEPDPDVASIGSANWSGGFAAAQHLIELGHRRIGMISGPEDMLCAVARVDGYRAALDRAGIAFDPALVRYGDFHVIGGQRQAQALLALEEPPTAIFAGSDLQAFGVYEAARVRGYRIPDDLSVVGYDDLSMARWAGPPLTTIRQPLAEMAETATRLVLALSEDPDTPRNRRVDLATSLVVRESTRPPRAAGISQ
ncbi:MAG TPA: LacI family DNA-binding transcriptional regulator [Solirubrobacteraceae bacterium]|nr:LacI family DNA-binding transcriptional regulator [Solirubrobacteraceae bacterium]